MWFVVAGFVVGIVHVAMLFVSGMMTGFHLSDTALAPNAPTGMIVAWYMLMGSVFGFLYGIIGALPFAAAVFTRPLPMAWRCAVGIGALVSLTTVTLTVGVEAVYQANPEMESTAAIDIQLMLQMFSALGGYLLSLFIVSAYLPETWSLYPAGCCQRCGYDRTGLIDGAACPECNAASPRRMS